MIDKPPKDPNYSTEHYITSNKGSCSDWLPDFIHHFIYSIWKNTIQTVLLQSLIGTVWSISARKRFLITIPTFSVNFYFRTNVEYDSSTQNMIWSENVQITVFPKNLEIDTAWSEVQGCIALSIQKYSAELVCIQHFADQSCDWRASELKGGNLFTTSELLILKCYVFDWILKVLWSQTFDMR